MGIKMLNDEQLKKVENAFFKEVIDNLESNYKYSRHLSWIGWFLAGVALIYLIFSLIYKTNLFYLDGFIMGAVIMNLINVILYNRCRR